MDLRRLLKKNRRPTRRKSRGRASSPKNGALIVALAASILCTVALGLLNLRLWDDPPPVREVQGESPGNQSARARPDKAGPGLSNSKTEKSPNRPVMRFYHDLETQDDRVPQGLNATSGQVSDTPNLSDTQKKAEVPSDKSKSKQRLDRPPAAIPVAGAKPAVESPKRPTQPKLRRSTREYTVQVGAFSHPGIALQWAEKWKARGYKVTLKPVARPDTGVIYRLHLGRFSSKKRADSLVNRLRTKDGVSAMRLLVKK